MDFLAKQTGLKIDQVIYDSTPLQLMGSELYKKDISLKDGDFRLNNNNRMFDLEQIKHFKQKTKELNTNKHGDQAAFILSKISIKE